MRPPLFASVFLIANLALAAAPERPVIQKLRDRYKEVTARLDKADGQSPYSVSLSPADSSARASLQIAFVAKDGFDADSRDETLELARVVQTWSNLGPQTAEYLYDEKGVLLFHYTEVAIDGARRRALRLWFDGGVLIRAQDDQHEPVDEPTAAHKAAARRAQKEAARLLARYRDLRAVKVDLP